MNHHTKEKGDFGVLKVAVDLCERGYLICTPLTEHAAFDIVVYKDKKFLRIQVKYKSLVDGKVKVAFCSSWADRHGSHVRQIDKTEVDLIGIYCKDTDKCYYIDPSKFKKSVTLSTLPNIKRGYRLEDYRTIPI